MQHVLTNAVSSIFFFLPNAKVLKVFEMTL